MQMFDETKKENWGGAWAIAIALIVLLTLPACTNVKYSFQIEDLGETQQYNQELKTAKKGSK